MSGDKASARPSQGDIHLHSGVGGKGELLPCDVTGVKGEGGWWGMCVCASFIPSTGGHNDLPVTLRLLCSLFYKWDHEAAGHM